MRRIGAELAFSGTSAVVTTGAGTTGNNFAMVHFQIDQPALINVAGNTAIGG